MSTAKIALFCKGSIKLQRYENRIFFLPVNILTVLHAGFLAIRHTTMCLDKVLTGTLVWCNYVCECKYLFTVSIPQLRDLHNLVTPDFAAQWRSIGIHLGLKVGLLDVIDHDHLHRAEDCCNAVWEQWLDMDSTTSWSKVIEAVESSAVVSVVHKAATPSDFSQDSVPVTTARIQLQKFYIQERYKMSEDDWPSYQPEHFTSVALIHHREKHVTTREVISIANVMHKGQVDVGYISEEKQEDSSYLHYSDSKITTNIAEIFSKLTSHTTQGDSRQVEPRVILIEGSPGIGKTILSKEIAFQWANNKLLNQKLLLFLMFLRDPYLQNVQTIEQFVCYAINSAQRNSMVTAIEQYLEETSGEHCMIVFDGYDEISEEIRSDSFISKIINRKVLKLCSLVITSRPTTSAVLHGTADRRVEILGFTKEDRKRYLHQSLGGNIDEIKKIEEYFEANPFIDSLCYIPLNMTILICLLKTSLEPSTGFPKSQTEINKQFTFVTIARYLMRTHNHTLTVKRLQSLPPPYKEQLDNVAKLAFVFLGKDKIVFNDDDIATDCPDCVGKWGSLGLLKTVKYHNFHEDSTSFSYNFLHFSIQEFLAAYYIVSLSDNKQIKILKNEFWNSKYLNTGIMFFGLTNANSFALKHFLSGRKFVIVSKLFGAKHIRKRVSTDKVKCLHLFQCFLEAGNDELVQKVGKFLVDDTIDLSNYALLHKDIHIFSFFLIRSANKKWKMLDLSSCYIGDQGFDIFTRSFAECRKNKTTTETINISYNHLTPSSIDGIINLILCFKTEKLILCNNNIDYEELDDKLLRNCIADSSVVKVEVEKVKDYEISLYFINCKFDLGEDIVLCKPNLRLNFYFYNASCYLCDFSMLTVSHHMHLISLSVYEECLNNNKQAVNIATALQQLCHLGRCRVEYVLQSNANLFAYNTKITKISQALNNGYIFQHHETINPKNSQWKNINLYHCSVGDTGYQVIMSQFVKQDHLLYFDTFNISDCELTDLSINTIFDLLKVCVIKKLIISDNCIPNGLLCDIISSEIVSHSKILNFTNQVSMIIFNDHKRDHSNSESEPVYSVTKYIVNCDIDDDTVLATINLDKSTIFYEIFLSNINLLSKNFERILFLCENPFLNINIFQINISEELQDKIISTLQSSNRSHYSYVLTSDAKLMAYKAKQKNIIEGLNGNPPILTLEVKYCKLNLCKFDSLQGVLSNSAKKWNTIDLSGCNIQDNGCEILCLYCSNCRINIKTLNLSNNHLTFCSVSFITKVLQHCVIEKLVVSQNEISDEDIHTSLSNHYSSNNAIMNFMCDVPLHVVVSLQHVDVPCNISCVYLMKSSLDLQLLQDVLVDNEQLYNISLVDSIMKNIQILMLFSDLAIKLFPISVNSLDKCQEIISAFKSKKGITAIDFSYCNFTDASCGMLCNRLFNPGGVLKCIKQLNLSGNVLTESCLGSVLESLQHCVIQQLIISDNFIQNQEFTDIIFAEYLSNSKICNFKLGIPLTVVNNSSSLKTGYTATVLLNNTCVNENLPELFTTGLQGYHIVDYTFYFTNSDIMVDDLNQSLSMLCNNLPNNGKVFVCETDLSDQTSNSTAKFLSRMINFNYDVQFILSSTTQLIVHKFRQQFIFKCLLTNPSITTLQLKGCKLNPDDLIIICDLSPNQWKCVDLSECHIGYEGFKTLVNGLLSKSYVPYFKTLNVSMNSLTSSSIEHIVRLLCHCIIKHLVLSGNDIDDNLFNVLLCRQKILNSVHVIPLVVTGTVLYEDIAACNIYIAANTTADSVCYLYINDSVEHYYIYHLKDIIYINMINRAIFSFKCKDLSFQMRFLRGAMSDSVIMLTIVLRNLKLIFMNKYQNTIDLSPLSFDDAICSMLCNTIFNKHSLLRCINTLDLSSTLLGASGFIDCLQYCCINYIIVSENCTLQELADLVLKKCTSGKRILNSILMKPLTLISHTAEDIYTAAVKHAITYFIHFKTESLEEMSDALQYKDDLQSHKLVFFNCLSKYQTSAHLLVNYLQLVTKDYKFSCMLYEIGLNDEMLLDIMKSLESVLKRAEYILSSDSLLVVSGSTIIRTLFNLVIHNTSSIHAIVFKQCLFSHDTFEDLGIVLTTEMKHIKSITLSKCNLNNSTYKRFYVNIFSDRGMVQYLKKLDISNNCITPSGIHAIILSLQSCVIEKLVISDYELYDVLVTVVFITAYRGRNNLLNFINGVPLIIINNKHEDHPHTDLNNLAIFIVNCGITDYCIHLIPEIPVYQFSNCNIFVLNNCIESHSLKPAIVSLQKLMQNAAHFTLFGTDLTDEVMIKLADCLNQLSHLTTEYFLVSNTAKLKSKLSNLPSSHLIDVVGCSIGEEMFGMFCKSCFSEVSHVTQLDISAYQLTSFCVDILINILQNCSVEKITLVNNNNILDHITDAIFGAYCTEKKMQLFISGIPLIVVGHTKVNEHTEVWASLFCVNVYANKSFEEKLDDLLMNKKYARLNCVLLDFFKRSMVSVSKFFSKFVAQENCSFNMYEVGLEDKAAANIVEELAVQEHIQYVFVSPTTFLALNSSTRLIFKGLADILHISVLTLTEYMLSIDESSNVLCAINEKMNCLQKISLSHCDVGDEDYKRFSGIMFSHKNSLSYLKELDVSHNPNTPIGSMITASLQFCIIEKLVIADIISYEVNNHFFNSAYCEDNHILNFIKGIPLIVAAINPDNEMNSSVNSLLDMTSITVFIVNAEVNYNTINRITRVVQYDIFSYNFFLLGNTLILRDLNHAVLLFQQLQSAIKDCTIFGSNLSDKVAEKVSSCLKDVYDKSIKYYLISETKLLSNMPCILPISRWLATNPITKIPCCNIGEDIFAKFCVSLSKYPFFLKEIDISSYTLTSKCIQTLVDCFQYCCIEKLLIFNYSNKLHEITDAIFDAYNAGKMLRNSISGVPLAVIARTKKDNGFEVFANLYFIEFMVDEKFETVLCDFHTNVNYGQLQCYFLNFFSKNQRMFILHNKILSNLLIYYCTNIVIYEVGLDDEAVMEIVELLSAVYDKVKYILASKTMLLAYRTELIPIINALTSNSLISTIKFKRITFYEGIDFIGSLLSTNFNCVRNIALTNCHINDTRYEKLSGSLFNDNSVISYLKVLDISYNSMKHCSSKIIESLHWCIVERLVLSGENVFEDLNTSIFLKAYYCLKDILNFVTGIPLTIVYSAQEEESSMIKNTIAMFLIKTALNEQTVHQIADTHNIADFNLFMKDNILLCNFKSILLNLEHVLENITNLSLFGTDVMDEFGSEIVQRLSRIPAMNIQYFLVLKTKLLTNATSAHPLSKVLHKLQNPDVLNQLTGMFCKSLSYSENLLKYFKCLDLSSYELSSTYTKLLVNSLQYCCVEKLVVLNHDNVVDEVTNCILHGYFEGKKIMNTISRVPLKVIGINNLNEMCIKVYLVEIIATTEVLESIVIEQHYDKLQYIFLNTLQNVCVLPHEFLSKFLAESHNSLFVCEVGLQDETAIAIAEQLKTGNQHVQYVLASQALLLGYRAEMRFVSLIKPPTRCLSLINKMIFTECIISTSEFGSIFSTNLNSITLSQCLIISGSCSPHNDALVCNSLYNKVSYLKQLDLSHCSVSLACVNTIMKALQVCIIEKIFLAEKSVNDELVYEIFLTSYKKNSIINFQTGVPLMVINNVQRKKSLADMCSFTIFLMNSKLDEIISQITNISGYIVYDYKLFLLQHNVLTNLNIVIPTLQSVLSKLTNFTLFAFDLFNGMAMEIATYLTDISKINIEFYLIGENISLTKITNIQPILRTISIYKERNIKDAIAVLPIRLVGHVELLDISGCSISNEQFCTLNEILLQFCTKIKILDVSYNKISPCIISKAIMDFHVQQLYLHGEFYKVQDNLVALLPLARDMNHNLEIRFSETAILILCDVQSDLVDILNSVMSSNKLLHFFALNCSPDNHNQFLDVIVPTLNTLLLSILSSVHLYNNFLKPRDIIKVVEHLKQVSLFVEEYDFQFQSVCNAEFSNISDVLYFASELCSTVQMQWTSTMTKITRIKFYFKDPAIINTGAMMTQKLLIIRDLQRLQLANFYLTDEVFSEVVTIFANSSALEYLELVNLNLSDHNLMLILQALRKIHSLRNFTVDSINIIADTCADHIAHIIASNENLRLIKICNCNLKESAILAIATAIKVTNSLEHLDLSRNFISNVAAGGIAGALYSIYTLKHLDLSSTKLQEAGMIDIMRGLSNTSLEYLSLNNCNISQYAATEIASCVLGASITHIELANCKVEEASLICIIRSLANISSLHSLNLKFNTISEDAAANLANIIRNNSKITHLKLTLSHTDVIKVASSCKILSSLKCIDWNFPSFNTKFSYFAKFCLEDIIFTFQVADLHDPYTSIEKDIIEITHLTFANCGCTEMFNCLVLLQSLQHLDVSSCRLPYDVISTAIKNNVSLHYVNISDLSWKRVDNPYTPKIDMFYEIVESLSSLQQLKYINISGNAVTNRIAGAIADTIYNNKRLQHFDLSNCRAQTTGLLTILEALSSIKYLSYLDMSLNYFSRETVEELTKVISNNRELVELHLSNCALNEDIFLVNAKSFQHLNHLRHLNLSKNIINGKTISLFEKVITNNVNLQYFDIGYCKLTEKATETIIHGLKMISSLKCINIGQCKMSCCIAEHLANVISGNEHLEHLNLSDFQLKNVSILKILSALKQRSLLKYLNFESNLFHTGELPSERHEYVLELGGIVNNNKYLEYFNISNCGLSGSEVTYITKTLSGLSHLQHFDISHNIITDEAAVGVASVITNNALLEHLYMSNCDMEKDGIEIVNESLLQCRYLHTLNLSNNYITESAAKRLLDTIANNKLLEYLDLSCCSRDGYNLCDIIFGHCSIFNCTIRHLDLGSNPIRNDTAVNLASFLHEDCVVEYLDLSNCKLSASSLQNILSLLQEIRCLHYLNLGANKLTVISALLLKNVILANNKLMHLCVPACDDSGKPLEEIILSCKLVEYFDISSNNMGDDAVCDLSTVINESVSLRYLNMNSCTMTRVGREMITNVIADIACLKCTVVDYNPLEAAVVSNFALLVVSLAGFQIFPEPKGFNILKPLYYINLRPHSNSKCIQNSIASAFSMVNIVYLSIHNYNLRECNVIMILEAAQQLSTLQYLILASCRIPEETLEAIALIIYSNTNIKHLDISDCELSGLEVAIMAEALSKLSHLQFLNISHNEISDEAAVKLASAITNNTMLEYLNLSCCEMSDFDVHSVCDALTNINSLLSLDISDNHITTKSAEKVADALSSNNALRTICFSNCFTEYTVITIVSQTLKHIKTLEHVELAGNIIDDSTADDIRLLLTTNDIQYLNISICTISDIGMHKLLSALEEVVTLEYLFVQYNKLNYGHAEIIKQIMKQNCYFKHLDASNCGLSHFQVMSLITLALTVLSSVEYIDLSLNSEPETVSRVVNDVPLLIANNSLKYINIFGCYLEEKDMCDILLILSMCVSLKSLNLHSCTIPDGVSVGCVIANNRSLNYLDLCDCKLKEEDIIEIAESLRVTESIEHILLSCNVITDRAARALANTMRNIPLLKLLAFSNCKLEESGLLLIANTLQTISTLQHLDLSYNNISDKVAVSIASVLSNNTSLEYLDMSCCTWSNNGLAIIQETLHLEKSTLLKEVDFSTL